MAITAAMSTHVDALRRYQRESPGSLKNMGSLWCGDRWRPDFSICTSSLFSGRCKRRERSSSESSVSAKLLGKSLHHPRVSEHHQGREVRRLHQGERRSPRKQFLPRVWRKVGGVSTLVPAAVASVWRSSTWSTLNERQPMRSRRARDSSHRGGPHRPSDRAKGPDLLSKGSASKFVRLAVSRGETGSRVEGGSMSGRDTKGGVTQDPTPRGMGTSWKPNDLLTPRATNTRLDGSEKCG